MGIIRSRAVSRFVDEAMAYREQLTDPAGLQIVSVHPGTIIGTLTGEVHKVTGIPCPAAVGAARSKEDPDAHRGTSMVPASADIADDQDNEDLAQDDLMDTEVVVQRVPDIVLKEEPM